MNQQYRRLRYPTRFPLIVKTQTGQQKATVVDINADGARLEGVQGLKSGDRVVLMAMNEQVTGTIRWVAKDRVGIAFTIPARASFVDIVRHASRATPMARSHGFAPLREMR